MAGRLSARGGGLVAADPETGGEPMISKIAVSLCLTLAVAAFAGCSAQPSTDEENAGQAAATAADAPPPGLKVASGTVVETLEAASYTYVRVDTGGEEIWAATNRFEVAVGDRVTVPLETPMEDFHSDSLDRDFPLVYFASRIIREGEETQRPIPAGHPPVTGTGTGNGESALVEPVERSEGGLTVAEVWAQRADLAGTKVTVRGRVVKYNAGIMDANWLHVQDGSGDPAAGTHDLTVTTSGTVSPGDVVTVVGVVAVDQDFGFGYSYPVMLTGAAIQEE